MALKRPLSLSHLRMISLSLHALVLSVSCGSTCMSPSLSRPARLELDSPSRPLEIWNGNDVVQAAYEGAAPRPSPHA